MQRRRRTASRNAGFSATVSDRALMISGPSFGALYQTGISPHRMVRKRRPSSAVTADGHSSGTRVRSPNADDTNRHATLDGAAEPPPTVPIRASAIVVRLSLLDRLLDAIDALRDRWRQTVRAILRRSPLSG